MLAAVLYDDRKNTNSRRRLRSESVVSERVGPSGVKYVGVSASSDALMIGTEALSVRTVGLPTKGTLVSISSGSSDRGRCVNACAQLV
jgi:hypothetical protein